MEKDVFIVHTRRYRLQRTLYDYLSTQARKCNFQVLNYNDWEWETPGERIVDVVRRAHRDPDPYEQLPARINQDKLTRLWSSCRVLAIVNPAGLHELKEGAQYELKKLPEFFAMRRNQSTPIPVVLNLNHDRLRKFRGIPVAQTLSMIDVGDAQSCENAFALIALAWLAHGIESSRRLGGYLLAPSEEFQEPLFGLLQGRRLRLRAETDVAANETLDETALSAIGAFERFWKGRARKVQEWFSRADDRSPCVEAGRTLITVVASRLRELGGPVQRI